MKKFLMVLPALMLVASFAAPLTSFAAVECDDLIDNDQNGLIDYPADKGCTSPSDTTEFSGGGSMPWCSGPMAPGWRVDLPGGGCGQVSTKTASGVVFSYPVFFKAGSSVVKNGVSYSCPESFFMGCVI